MATKTTTATPTTKMVATSSLSDSELIKIAQQVVPERLRGSARVNRPKAGKAALAGKPVQARDLASEVAGLVGASLPPDDPTEATVDFAEESPLGKRHTAVHLRGGKIVRVVKRA